VQPQAPQLAACGLETTNAVHIAQVYCWQLLSSAQPAVHALLSARLLKLLQVVQLHTCSQQACFCPVHFLVPTLAILTSALAVVPYIRRHDLHHAAQAATATCMLSAKPCSTMRIAKTEQGCLGGLWFGGQLRSFLLDSTAFARSNVQGGGAVAAVRRWLLGCCCRFTSIR